MSAVEKKIREEDKRGYEGLCRVLGTGVVEKVTFGGENQAVIWGKSDPGREQHG